MRLAPYFLAVGLALAPVGAAQAAVTYDDAYEALQQKFVDLFAAYANDTAGLIGKVAEVVYDNPGYAAYVPAVLGVVATQKGVSPAVTAEVAVAVFSPEATAVTSELPASVGTSPSAASTLNDAIAAVQAENEVLETPPAWSGTIRTPSGLPISLVVSPN